MQLLVGSAYDSGVVLEQYLQQPMWLGENKHKTFQNSTRLIFNGASNCRRQIILQYNGNIGRECNSIGEGNKTRQNFQDWDVWWEYFFICVESD